MKISRAKVKDFIVSNKKIIGAKNVKQDGTLRSWSFRIDVDRTNGGTKPYNDDDFGYLTVWDMNKNGYRTLDLNTLIELTIDKERIEIGDQLLLATPPTDLTEFILTDIISRER